MREFYRIERIMSLIKQIWEKHPDLRFNQLISHLSWEYTHEHEGKYIEYSYSKLETSKGSHFTKDVTHVDLFHVEDDKYEDFLKRYLSREPYR